MLCKVAIPRRIGIATRDEGVCDMEDHRGLKTPLPAAADPGRARPVRGADFTSSSGTTYARARLWLGVSCVGFFVTLAAVALAVDAAPGLFSTETQPATADALALLAFGVAYAALHLPFDLLGGLLLPRRFKRNHRRKQAEFARSIARGAIAHWSLLVSALLLIHFSSRAFGLAGVVAAVAFGVFAMLTLRLWIARAVSPLKGAATRGGSHRPSTLRIRTMESVDEGFTGGITGVLRPRVNVEPCAWADELSDAELVRVRRRRELAAESGLWLRGRVASIAFVLLGAALAGALTGADRLGTAAGTVELSLWFTLWSFLGLLLLPTPSRAAILRIDRDVAAEFGDAPGNDPAASSLRRLDRLADDEPDRPAGIEAIFHPIPSVSRRLGRETTGSLALWDVARTAVYLGAASGSLLSRSVHCNCGRPSLWVFLPSS